MVKVFCVSDYGVLVYHYNFVIGDLVTVASSSNLIFLQEIDDIDDWDKSKFSFSTMHNDDICVVLKIKARSSGVRVFNAITSTVGWIDGFYLKSVSS